jgi:hypothetical protein
MNRSFISKAVLCQMCGAWLGFETTDGVPNNAGVGANPYRQDLIKLLVQKGVGGSTRQITTWQITIG